MWEHTGGWGMGWIGLGLLHMIVFWAVVIFFIVLAVRWFSRGPGDTPPTGKTPLDIARERYARGDIDREEFERLRRDLGE